MIAWALGAYALIYFFLLVIGIATSHSNNDKGDAFANITLLFLVVIPLCAIPFLLVIWLARLAFGG